MDSKREEHNAKLRQRWAVRTPERIASDRAANKKYCDSRRERINRLKRENMARNPEQRARNVARHKRWEGNLSHEQKAALAEKSLEQARKRRANRTPEQIAGDRAYGRAYCAKWTPAQRSRAKATGRATYVRRCADHLDRKRYANNHYGEYADAWVVLMLLKDEQRKQMESDDGK